jgi:hydrogenase nickel incorporation protein HypA/HybF
MHEMGIAYSVLTAVDQELQRYPGRRAAKVGVRIGEFAGVDTESLRFCFDVIVKSSDLAPLELDVECRSGDELDLAYLELEEIER